jgi:hypothetical protein
VPGLAAAQSQHYTRRQARSVSGSEVVFRKSTGKTISGKTIDLHIKTFNSFAGNGFAFGGTNLLNASKVPMTIAYTDFGKVEMRVGRVARVEFFSRARQPAYKLWVDFGELGIKQSSAQGCEECLQTGRQVGGICGCV